MGKVGYHAHNFIDMSGWKMWEHGVPDSRIIVIEQTEKRIDKPKMVYWKCKCACGNPEKFIVASNSIRNGNTLSCGCVKAERHPHTHGEGGKRTKLYMIWNIMRKRCSNKHNKSYKWYGARGIKVCDEWDKDYVKFKEWANLSGYRKGLELDRIDNDGNYEPSNCCWVTHKEQCNNRRTSIWIEYNNERKLLTEWSKIINIPHSTLYARYENGWTVNEMIETSHKMKRKDMKNYEKS